MSSDYFIDFTSVKFYAASSMSGFLTVGQAAKKIGVSRQAVHQMIKDGRLRGVVWMLERWAIPEVEVDRILKERVTSEAA